MGAKAARAVRIARAMRDRAAELRWAQVHSGAPNAFAVFCQYFIRIVTDVPGQRVRLVWNDIQAEFEARRTGWDIVLKARQVGFTTMELARDLFFAITRPGVAVGIVVPPHKEALHRRRVVRTLRDMVASIGRSLGDEWSGATLALANGSTLTVMDAGGSEDAAGKMARGGTYHRAHISELAHFPYAEMLLEALLASVPGQHQGGEFVAESTPRGVGGMFFALWQGAVAQTNGLTPHFYPWYWMRKYSVGKDENGGAALLYPDKLTSDEAEVLRAAAQDGIRISPGQLTWWRQRVATLGLRKVVQEYPHDPRRCFLLSGDSYFDAAALERMEARASSPLGEDALCALGARTGPAQFYTQRLAALAGLINRGVAPILRVWVPPEPGGRYLIAVDCAGGGVNGDWLVAVVLRRNAAVIPGPDNTPGTARSVWRHVATLRARVPPPEFARWTQALARAYGDALVAVERNGHGGTVLHVLHQELEYPHLWRDMKLILGWWTGPHNRLPAIDALGDALLQDVLESPDPVFHQEVRTFVVHKDGRVAGDRGCSDDVVMAMVIAWAVLHGPRMAERGVRAGMVPQPLP